jgi:tRNA threonylcarbamoyladenosine biosynthesis protein TsaE
MKAVIQPSLQTGLGCAQIYRGYANLRKSQFSRPSADFGEKLNTVSHDALIVGSLQLKNLVWPNEDATQAWAAVLASHSALDHATIELHGDLGAGKTTLVRHLLRALGVQGRIKSPSYAVVEPHNASRPQGDLSISHFDFYRFTDPREWEDAGFREIFAEPGLKLIEWADNARAALPIPDLAIYIKVENDDSRIVTLRAYTQIGQTLLA